jgi:hypothetical protein
MTPPKMVPSALVSFGSSSTLMAGTRSGICQGYIFFFVEPKKMNWVRLFC